MTSTTLNRRAHLRASSLNDCPGCVTAAITPAELGWLDRQIAARLRRRLGHVQAGLIEWDDGGGGRCLGTASPDGLAADWRICDPKFYRALLRGDQLALAESYIQGFWDSSDLTSLLRILYRNAAALGAGGNHAGALRRWWATLAKWLVRNTISGSRRNIAAHYDLGNDFFELFLDATLTYSAAFYESDTATLEQASIAKLDRICRKVELTSDDHLLEIGTGWGSFALHAAGRYGSRVTTTTISKNQFDYARARVSAAGLDAQVRVQQRDYRELSGRFDKLVSIEMVEAVGERFLNEYFRRCGALLRPGGRMAIQAIVMPEGRFAAYRRSVDFIQHYVFPGGFLPTVAGLCQAAGESAGLNLRSAENLSAHYARTLYDWRTRFLSRLDAVRQLGFSDSFLRLWEYYLCYCEAGFREDAVQVVQLVWDKPRS